MTRSARALTTALVASAALLAASFAGTAPAFATTTPDPDPAAPAQPVRMPDFSLDSYQAEAAELPDALVEALADDLGQTPEGYLASADAAADATAVLDALAASGVEVLASRLEGTRLVVTVPDDAAVAAVEAANATAELGDASDAPSRTAAEAAGVGADLEPLADLVGGQGYYFDLTSTSYYACSVAFNGSDARTGAQQFLTAGHCRVNGDGDTVGALTQAKPSDPQPGNGGQLGTRVAGSFTFGDEIDAGLVAPSNGWSPQPVVGTWGSGGNNSPVTSGTQQAVRDYGDAVVGQQLCKSGRTTGWTCGTVTYVDQLLAIGAGGPKVNLDLVSGMCSKPGDSGGSVVSGSYAMGLLSAGSTSGACTPSGVSAVFPMEAPVVDGQQWGSVRSYEKNWTLSVDAPTPAITAPSGALAWGEPITGTLPLGTTSYSVTVKLDGVVVGTSPVGSDLSWSVPLYPAADGPHTVEAVSTFGNSTSDAATAQVSVEGAPQISRIAGADRFAGAVEISQAAYPGTAPVVYVVTGLNYPDALSAGPAALKEGGPLLLVTQNEVPAVVATEIGRLQPGRIVVVGGPNSVSAGVLDTLGKLAPDATVERLSGADRYAASRAVVSAVFSSSAHSYAATGTNFPDALSAGGAAGSQLQPVVLVNGSQPAADAATIQLFRDLDADSITVVGGPNSVSEGVASSLGSVPASVDRVSASDRYQTSIALNRSAFDSAGTVYLATGLNFPDALAGGVLAGVGKAPLYVVPTDCVPTGVLADVVSLGASKVVLLGGPNSLAPSVEALKPC